MINLKCFFKGHVLIDKLWEDDELIYVKICANCGKPFGRSIFKPFRECLPLNSSEAEKESWYKYFDSRLENARNNLIID